MRNCCFILVRVFIIENVKERSRQQRDESSSFIKNEMTSQEMASGTRTFKKTRIHAILYNFNATVVVHVFFL